MVDPVSSEGYATYLADRRRTDRNHLFALSIFHYLLAVIAAVNLAAVARYSVAASRMQQRMHNSHALARTDWFLAAALVVFGLATVLNAASGWCLTRRRAWTLSIVVAGLDLLYVPIGTLLGVFTLIVLLRGSVGEWYRENAR